eukprot:CAMPEP_0174282342 /NCGR_PEP_ID=MMETSP0809-20121228/2850_1 /TAXON_ID=73025 ORGANISM="Eutreptiella gymnastica-like, Strain CCMP1594" /NCGR_SAMPLE_ID=MMETSP0809 /ASSEMBLY_ACC=CAM_ASM_000658 /LENGTH=103 /DNA_ID=CAMNT_0015376489 /DNA_START=198 /DNA_END=506 /DNA_ORIENTATION=+
MTSRCWDCYKQSANVTAVQSREYAYDMRSSGMSAVDYPFSDPEMEEYVENGIAKPTAPPADCSGSTSRFRSQGMARLRVAHICGIKKLGGPIRKLDLHWQGRG